MNNDFKGGLLCVASLIAIILAIAIPACWDHEQDRNLERYQSEIVREIIIKWIERG